MDKSFWNGKRAPGIPDEPVSPRFDNLVQYIDQALGEFSDKPAFTGLGHTLSYTDIDRLSDAFCRYLQHCTDLEPGDRIAIQMANLPQYPVVLYGALRAGLVIVNTNPLYTTREMEHQFRDADVKALVFMNMFGDRVQQALDRFPIANLIVTDASDLLPPGKRHLVALVTRYIKKVIPKFDLPGCRSLRHALSLGQSSAPRRAVQTTPDDLALLQYTGGTSGTPKGAMLTHQCLIANMRQLQSVLMQVDDQGNPLIVKGQEILVTPLPLYHIYAFTVHMLVALCGGHHNLLIANPRDTQTFVKALQPWDFTLFFGIDTLFTALAQNDEFKKMDFSSLKATNSGGTTLKPETNKLWHSVTGCEISEGYGLTECSPVVCTNGNGNAIHHGTVGLPVPGTAVKVVDKQGDELTIGEAGELCVSGPQVMKGYWKKSEATDEAFDPDGWFKTGDVAIINDQGVVRIIDRLKDVVLVSGFNVYPNEIENVVVSHPAIEQAAAIGVADDKSGEAVKLFVVANDPKFTEADLLEYCRHNLTAYKIPRHVEFRDELPMTAVGKVLRKDLRQSEPAKANL